VGQLGELGVDAAQVVRTALVAGRNLGLAHRKRLATGLHRAEAALLALGLLEQLEIDLDLVDLLHAADVRAAELLVRVEERAPAVDAGRGVHDLVAMDAAAAAFNLVLGSERELGRDL